MGSLGRVLMWDLVLEGITAPWYTQILVKVALLSLTHLGLALMIMSSVLLLGLTMMALTMLAHFHQGTMVIPQKIHKVFM